MSTDLTNGYWLMVNGKRKPKTLPSRLLYCHLYCSIETILIKRKRSGVIPLPQFYNRWHNHSKTGAGSPDRSGTPLSCGAFLFNI